MSRFKIAPGERLQWRVVVRTAGRVDPSKAALPLAWHLVQCTNPLLAEAHCPQGQALLALDSDPDGHCLADDVCPRCALAALQAIPAQAPPAPAPAPAPVPGEVEGAPPAAR